MNDTKLGARPKIELLREARALGQAMSIKTPLEAKVPGKDKSDTSPKSRSLFDRSTARRETGIQGTSGSPSAKKSSTMGRGKATDSEARNAAGHMEGDILIRLARQTQPGRAKPKKLYNQKAASISKGISAREKAAAKTKGKSDNAKLVLALVLLLALGSGLYFSIPEVTRVNAVSVQGMLNVLESEIMDALALNEEINLVNADIPAMEARILGNPKVASVRIGRAFPDKLIVNLAERMPVACVLVTEELGTRSIALDKDGVAFAYMDSIASPGRVPVLSGIRFERFTPGQRLPEYLRPLLADIAELSASSPSPLEAFSEIRIEKISESEAELLLFPSGKTVPVRMPARLTRASLGSALLVLDILDGRQGMEKIEEIDFRTGTIVYRTKEAQAG